MSLGRRAATSGNERARTTQPASSAGASPSAGSSIAGRPMESIRVSARAIRTACVSAVSPARTSSISLCRDGASLPPALDRGRGGAVRLRAVAIGREDRRCLLPQHRVHDPLVPARAPPNDPASAPCNGGRLVGRDLPRLLVFHLRVVSVG